MSKDEHFSMLAWSRPRPAGSGVKEGKGSENVDGRRALGLNGGG